MDGMQNIPNTLFQKGKPYAEKEYLSIQKRSLLYHGDPGAGLDGSHQYRSHVRHHHGPFRISTRARESFRSKFIGLENFEYMFQLKDVSQIFTNTIVIAVGKLLLNVLVPVIFALLLNEIKNVAFKRCIQTVVYLPHFISWVIMGGILLDVFGLYGPINMVLSAFGMEPIAFFRISKLFRTLAIGTDVWKEFGFNAVVYLAALTGISPSLYEAAAIDGAGRWSRMWHITLPGLKPVIVLMTILALGNIIQRGLRQIYNIYNRLFIPPAISFDTWVYRVGLK